MTSYTYALGPKVVLTRDFTTTDAAALCDDLSRTFGPGYVFAPEAICEGGIEMRGWPGKMPGQYKTFRFGASSNFGKWPWIVPGTLEQWRHSPPAVVFRHLERRDAMSRTGRSTSILPLFLKAFHGAPCWTEEELRLVRGCFERLGFRTQNRPRGKLAEQGSLGKPEARAFALAPPLREMENA